VPYRIEYTEEARQHLRGLTASERSLVVDEIDAQLKHQPGTRTRNRKPMRLNQVAEWELRDRHLRAYYRIREEPEPIVCIRAIGVKVRSQVLIDGEEANLREEDRPETGG
jgi:hypothetical protein